MEEGTKSMQIHTCQLDLLPKLRHCIQSLLPPEEAARTGVLSKSWLHAFSTIPFLRFTKCAYDVNKIQEKRYTESIDRTLLRYLNENIPMKSIDLHIDTKHPKVVNPAVKWIQLASKSCLSELSLTIHYTQENYSFTIPAEIFSCETLNTLSLKADAEVRMHENPMIRCLSLRVLKLEYVGISEVVLNNLLSTCTLLEKIDISTQDHNLRTIKVKNLLYLQELKIQLGGQNSNLEICDVPSVRLFFYHPDVLPLPFKWDSLRSVRELSLGAVIMDKAFSNMINSEFPFLEVLTLKMMDCTLETLDITCVSLKRLSLGLRKTVQINIREIRVYASKLLYFCYNGSKMPSLLFPATSPEHIKLGLILGNRDDLSFFLNIREILNLSSTFDIEINDEIMRDELVPKNFNIDDLRRRTEFPARNVQQLSFKTRTTFADPYFPKHSLIIQALFSIFYPNYLRAYSPMSSTNVKNIMYKMIVEGELDKSILDLKDVQIKNPLNGEWETLTTNYFKSWRSCQDNGEYLKLSDEFKLNWCS